MRPRSPFFALAAALFVGPAFARPGSTPECPTGMGRAIDGPDHCCYPGQTWKGDRCGGVPTSCPPGLTPNANKETCGLLDTDGDGIPDSVDLCPTEQEDMNGFEDADGCPDEQRRQDATAAAKRVEEQHRKAMMDAMAHDAPRPPLPDRTTAPPAPLAPPPPLGPLNGTEPANAIAIHLRGDEDWSLGWITTHQTVCTFPCNLWVKREYASKLEMRHQDGGAEPLDLGREPKPTVTLTFKPRKTNKAMIASGISLSVVSVVSGIVGTYYLSRGFVQPATFLANDSVAQNTHAAEALYAVCGLTAAMGIPLFAFGFGKTGRTETLTHDSVRPNDPTPVLEVSLTGIGGTFQ